MIHEFEKVKLTKAEFKQLEKAAEISPCNTCEYYSKYCGGTKSCTKVLEWETRPKKEELRPEVAELYDSLVEINTLRAKRSELEKQLNEIQGEYNTTSARLVAKTSVMVTRYEIEG